MVLDLHYEAYASIYVGFVGCINCIIVFNMTVCFFFSFQQSLAGSMFFLRATETEFSVPIAILGGLRGLG